MTNFKFEVIFENKSQRILSETFLDYQPNRETLRSYMFFFSGQMFSLLGSLVVFFVIVVWITDVTGSVEMLSIANFINLIPILLIFPFAGVISDRYDRRIIILIADSLQAFLTAIMALLFIFDFTNVWLVLVFLGLRSVCQAFHMPTVSAIIPSMIPKDKLSRVNGIRYMFVGMIQLIGPAVGATLLVFFPIKYILWIDVITFFIALFPLITLKTPTVQTYTDREKKNSFIKEISEGFLIMKRIPGLLTIMLLAMLLYMLSQPAMVLAPYYIKIIHGGSNLRLALIEMILQGGMILGAIIVSLKKNWNNKMRTLFIGITFINIGYLLYAVAPIGFYPLIGIGSFIMGFIMPIVDIIVMTVIQTTVPIDKMGRVSSILHTLIMIATPIGAILSGPLSILLGVSNLYILCALVSLIITVIPYLFPEFRHIDYDQVILDSIK
jgi:DHA3 family macrolide efflux protein-like MFS transporter